MQNLPYADAPDLERSTPLPVGTHRPSPRRTVLMVLLGVAMTLASAWVLQRGLSGETPATVGAVLVGVGCIGTAFFGLAAVVWPFQALVVTEDGLRSRIPLPGSTRVEFSDVRAVVVFPMVATRAGTMPTVALLGSDGRQLFRLSSPPYPETVIDGLPARVHRSSGAPVRVCRQEVTDTMLVRRIHLPDLV